jgi:hypothetical protein
MLLAFFATLAASSVRAEYWTEPIDNTRCSDGFTCARIAQIAAYGTKILFGPCNYDRTDSGGYLVGATCKGWLNSSSWFLRYGYATLHCETGEVKSTNGCIKAPIPDKDPPCRAQAANPVDTSTGMKLEYALDFSTGGPLPLKLERHYRSHTNTKDGKYKISRLGTGWRTNFDSSAYYWPTIDHPSDSIRFVLPDGTFYSFKTSGGVFMQRYYSWTKKNWVNVSVNRSAKAAWNSTVQRYELTTPDDTVWSYDTNGRLRTITYSG